MSLTTAAQVGFAAGVALAATALVGAGFRVLGKIALVALTALVCALATAAWVAYALHSWREIAIAAGGLTGAAIATGVSLALARALARVARLDAELDRTQSTLHELVKHEVVISAAELERTLTLARADSLSLLAEQERKIGEERRAAIAERERSAHAELLATLAETQKQVEQRLQDWAQDLERSTDAVRARLAELAQRQRQLTVDAESRIAADAERLKSESEEQRDAVTRLRTEVQHALEEAVAAARAELDVHAADRRRALHEIGERLRRRERELAELIEREETEAARRIQAGLAEVERKQIEHLHRAVQRAATGLSEEATQQFAQQIKSAREDAAQRLGRELDRAVASLAREAEGVLAERLAHVGDAGAQRIERRLSEITGSLDRQRDEFVRAFELRLGEAEDELRRRLAELGADADAERAILEARIQELARRLDEASSLSTG